MAQRKPYLSVIIPVVNEVDRLPLTLVDVDRHLNDLKYTYEIVVVDGGSSDGTIGVTHKFTKLISNLRVIESEGKPGQLVQLGMEKAIGKYKLFMEADNSTSVDQVKKALLFLKDGFDVVVGSRYLEDSNIAKQKSLLRRLVDWIGRGFIKLLFWLDIGDTQCGFKCFSAKAADDIFDRQKSKGWAFNIEVLALAKRLGYKTAEFGVSWVNDSRSRLGFIGYMRVLYEIFKIRYFLWRNKYQNT